LKPNPVILIVDADRPVRRLLRTILEPNRYKVFEAEDGEEGTKEAVARQPDVIIMDVCLPDVDGLDLLRRLRNWYRAPIMILSAEDNEERKVKALDYGANDFVNKPFGTAEMLARLRVLQRSNPGEVEGPFFINGNLHVNVTTHVATLNGHNVDFTPTEEALFYTLVRHAGQVVTCKHLLQCVWGADVESKIHDLHVHIRAIRKKLQGANGEVLIQTEGSAGYRLLVPSHTVNKSQAENSLERDSLEPVNYLRA
jgi:two-component system, OmpR family, KDP operon response regulator KdpE